MDTSKLTEAQRRHIEAGRAEAVGQFRLAGVTVFTLDHDRRKGKKVPKNQNIRPEHVELMNLTFAKDQYGHPVAMTPDGIKVRPLWVECDGFVPKIGITIACAVAYPGTKDAARKANAVCVPLDIASFIRKGQGLWNRELTQRDARERKGRRAPIEIRTPNVTYRAFEPGRKDGEYVCRVAGKLGVWMSSEPPEHVGKEVPVQFIERYNRIEYLPTTAEAVERAARGDSSVEGALARDEIQLPDGIRLKAHAVLGVEPTDDKAKVNKAKRTLMRVRVGQLNPETDTFCKAARAAGSVIDFSSKSGFAARKRAIKDAFDVLIVDAPKKGHIRLTRSSGELVRDADGKPVQVAAHEYLGLEADAEADAVSAAAKRLDRKRAGKFKAASDAPVIAVATALKDVEGVKFPMTEGEGFKARKMLIALSKAVMLELIEDREAAKVADEPEDDSDSNPDEG